VCTSVHARSFAAEIAILKLAVALFHSLRAWAEVIVRSRKSTRAYCFAVESATRCSCLSFHHGGAAASGSRVMAIEPVVSALDESPVEVIEPSVVVASETVRSFSPSFSAATWTSSRSSLSQPFSVDSSTWPSCSSSVDFSTS